MLKGAGVALASERRAVDPSPATLAHPQKSRERDPASATPEGLGAIRAASKLDETALPPRGLDTILLGLTFSVTGAPGDQAEPVTHDLLTTAPPAGGTGAGVGRLAQARVLCPGPGGGGPARPGLAGQGWVPTWPVRGPRGRCRVTPPPSSGPLALPGVSSVQRRRVLRAAQSHPPAQLWGFAAWEGAGGASARRRETPSGQEGEQPPPRRASPSR